MKKRRDYLIDAPDDGPPVGDAGLWAVEKYRRLGMYAEMFSTGMKRIWPTRVYIDLFSGPGHVIIRETKRRVLASPLIALSIPDRFSKYVFVEKDESFIGKLQERANRLARDADVSYVRGDANTSVTEIGSQIPQHSKTSKVLTFCFADPYDLGLHFETIRALGENRFMDFLILLAVGSDFRRNLETYRGSNTKVDRFLGDADWRERWERFKQKDQSEVRFLATEYAHSMAAIGYLTTSLDQMLPVRTADNNMLLYYLAFFSKNAKGYRFWAEVQKYASDELTLPF